MKMGPDRYADVTDNAARGLPGLRNPAVLCRRLLPVTGIGAELPCETANLQDSSLDAIALAAKGLYAQALRI